MTLICARFRADENCKFVFCHPWYKVKFVCLFASVAIVSLNSGCQTFAPFGGSITAVEHARSRQWKRGGLDALAKGRFEQARNYFQRARESSPDDPEIQVNIARAMVHQGDLAGAAQAYEQVVAGSNRVGNNSMTHVELGEVYLARGQWLHARRQADLALERDRHLPEAWVLRGKTEYAKGEWANALSDFQRALRYQPKMPDVQIQIAETYLKKGQPMRALSTAEQVLSQYPVSYTHLTLPTICSV